jgi:hypothetical protein
MSKNAKIIDYTVVHDDDRYLLIKKVRELIKDGYEPLDGIQVVAPNLRGHEFAPVYMQTLIKRIET